MSISARAGDTAEVIKAIPGCVTCKQEQGGRSYLFVRETALNACVCILQKLLKHQRVNVLILKPAEEQGRCLKMRDLESSICLSETHGKKMGYWSIT